MELTKAQATLLKIKSRIPFFKSLTNEEVIELTEDVHFVRFKKFEVIFEQGDEGKEAFFIAKGVVMVKMIVIRIANIVIIEFFIFSILAYLLYFLW